jgi:hypothetical protein
VTLSGALSISALAPVTAGDSANTGFENRLIARIVDELESFICMVDTFFHHHQNDNDNRYQYLLCLQLSIATVSKSDKNLTKNSRNKLI